MAERDRRPVPAPNATEGAQVFTCHPTTTRPPDEGWLHTRAASPRLIGLNHRARGEVAPRRAVGDILVVRRRVPFRSSAQQAAARVPRAPSKSARVGVWACCVVRLTARMAGFHSGGPQCRNCTHNGLLLARRLARTSTPARTTLDVHTPPLASGVSSRRRRRVESGPASAACIGTESSRPDLQHRCLAFTHRAGYGPCDAGTFARDAISCVSDDMRYLRRGATWQSNGGGDLPRRAEGGRWRRGRQRLGARFLSSEWVGLGWLAAVRRGSTWASLASARRRPSWRQPQATGWQDEMRRAARQIGEGPDSLCKDDQGLLTEHFRQCEVMHCARKSEEHGLPGERENLE